MRHLLFASLALISAAPLFGADLEVLVATEDGWAPAATLGAAFNGQPGWPIPLVTRSEMVQTLEESADGYGLRIYADEFLSLDEVVLTAIGHRPDEQVLLLEGKLTIVGPPVLVSNDTSLARQDSIFGPEVETELSPAPEGFQILGIPGQTDMRRARRVMASRLAPWNFDQVFAARLRDPGVRLPVEVASAALVNTSRRRNEATTRASTMPFGLVQLGLEEREELNPSTESFKRRVIGRGRCLEVFFEMPDSREGESMTLIVSTKTRTTPLLPNVPAPWSKTKEPRQAPLFAETMATFAGAFVHLEGPADQRDIRPTMGPGAAAGDVNGDGWLDLYLVQGGGREGEAAPTARLSVQVDPEAGQARPVFKQQTESGLNVPGRGMGALFFDADGDGDLDLYQANYGADFLFENRWHQREPGQKAFRAVPAASFERALTNGWSAGIAAGDVDLDGDLDLYVTSYLVFDEAKMPDDGELDRYSREDPIAMLPFAFPGARNLFLLNESEATIRFQDATEQFDLADGGGRSMQPIFWDFDVDGDLDLYVANDVSPNRFWRNEIIGPNGKARFSFKDVSFSTGMDDPRGGMGVDVGDVDGDLDDDLLLTNWQLEPNALYRSNLRSKRKSSKAPLHHATFQDVIVRSGLASTGVGTTSWGAVLFDADCDRDLDLFIPNGYTSPDYRTTGICVGQPNQFFLNDGKGRYEDASDTAGPAVTNVLASRAALAADFDQDGDLDLVVTTNNGPAQLLTNQHRQLDRAGHYLIVRLRGAGKNSQGIGARVRVTVTDSKGKDHVQERSLLAGKNYLAGNPPELFFGLGDEDKDVRIEVTWPSGVTTEHGPGLADRVVTLKESR